MKRILPALLLGLGLAACSDSTGSDGPELGSLTVSPATPFAEVGDTARLTVSATDADGQTVTPDVDFSSSNSSVASVNGDGVVTGVAPGTAIITASGRGASDQVTVTVVPAGSLLRLNANADDACTNAQVRKGRVVATSDRAVFVEDVANPSGSFTNAEYQAIANEFDDLIYPVDVANFGAPSDIDNNGGRVIVFYTRAVNELTPAGANFIIGGFFYARDLFPRTAQNGLGACPSSNVSEIFYMLAVDPDGDINGHRRSKEYVRENTIGTLAHEFEHLINSSRRLYVNTSADFPEEVWLDEGLAHVAEDLAFFARGGFGPRQNIDLDALRAASSGVEAFNEFAGSNFARFREYIRDVEDQSPIEDDDDLATRGAAWNFLRYAADRRPGDQQNFWRTLVNSQDTGYTNLAGAIATDPQPWLRDWTVANYADDLVPGLDARFQHLSYDFRSIFSALSGYPIQVSVLTNGTAVNTSIQASSAGYYRFAVPTGGTGDIRVSLGGTTEAGACTPQTLAVGQVYQGGSTPSALCFGPGQYVLIPYHASPSQTASTSITIVGTGIVAPAGAAAARTPALGPRLSMEPQGDGGFHLRLREREREDLSELAGRGTALRPSRDVQAAPADAALRIQVLRTN